MLNKILIGDCLDKLKELPDNSVDSIVTDPPYELGFMGKSWDNTGIANNKEMWSECLRVLKHGGHLLSFSGTRTYHRMAVAIEDAGFEVRDMIEWVYSTGFPKSLNLNKALQKKCTCGNMEAYDKQRTKQNTQYNLRPVQETNLSQEINTSKEQGEVLQSCLSEQSISFSRETTSNVWGEQPSVEGWSDTQKTEGKLQGSAICEMSERISANGEKGQIYNGTQISDGSTLEQTTNENGGGTSHRPQSEQQHDRKPCAFCEQLGTQETRRLYEETYGVGSALKPAHEPICLARKPLSEKTLVDNFIKYGTGGINIDESRVGTEEMKFTKASSLGNGLNMEGGKAQEDYIGEDKIGRFPANLIHDNSDEVKECFPESNSGKGKASTYEKFGGQWGKGKQIRNADFGDSGSASRFFKSIIYQAKASKSERNKGCEGLELKKRSEANKMMGDAGVMKTGSGNDRTTEFLNNHPTVKPVALMTYLIKMVTPKGGVVLDPFAGSGSTLVAAKQNGYQYIGIEMTEEYIPIIEARLKSSSDTLF